MINHPHFVSVEPVSRINKHNASKTTKAGTVAERVVWMTRTSDILGSHMKTDLDSYLTLIRRKIQEKCSTTAELITQIRRNKIGESGHVTPNEFRFTLIKFGVILPQHLVDRIFNVFDSDRSGTMDFDEFAMWIMNSEFRPALTTKKGSEESKLFSPRTVLRSKLSKCIEEQPRVFENMKKQISFLELVSDINRTGIPLSERDARSIFLLLDPHDTGFIDSSWLKPWAETGRYVKMQGPPPVPGQNGTQKKPLKEVVNRVIGWNTRQLENAFSHIVLGQGTKLPFEEFRRCLLNGGIGKNMADIRELFLAFGGDIDNLADVDTLFHVLTPVQEDGTIMDTSFHRAASAKISTSRADRRLRDALRKCYKDVKAEIEREDPSGSGHISPPALYKILVKRCMPLTFEDFRFVIQQMKKEDRGDKIDYRHFLHAYNPLSSSHQLEGLASLRKAASVSEGLTIVGMTSTNTRGSDEAGASGTLNKLAPLASSNQSNTATAAMNNKLRLVKTLPLNNNNAVTSSMSQRAITSAVDDINVRGNKGANNGTMDSFAGIVGSNVPELRKIWQQLLRECHRADPERTGQMNRITFINALEKADINKSLTPEQMSRLADQYKLSNGLVHYILLFRQYLSDVTVRSSSAMGPMGGSMKSQSMTNLDSTTGHSPVAHHESGHTHPWEFSYKREKHNDHPYWQQASANPKEPEAGGHTIANFTSTMDDKDLESLSLNDKTVLLARYSPAILAICAKCYLIFAPVWRPLRTEFKKSQISTQKGAILTSNFLNILESHGIQMKKNDLGMIVKNFRGLGMGQDIIRYDDFLRICMLMKGSINKSINGN